MVGLDVSQTMLERAVADTPGEEVAYVRGDIGEPIFRDQSFDAICCFAAFHLLADPMHALDRMTQLLTPGGRIALFTTARPRSAPAQDLPGAGHRAQRRGHVRPGGGGRGAARARASTTSACGSPASPSSWAAASLSCNPVAVGYGRREVTTPNLAAPLSVADLESASDGRAAAAGCASPAPAGW